MTQGINLDSQVERYLPRQIRVLLGVISREANLLGQRLYLVGGIVRDLLLNHPNFDFDLVTEGDAIVLARRMALQSLAMTASVWILPLHAMRPMLNLVSCLL